MKIQHPPSWRDLVEVQDRGSERGRGPRDLAAGLHAQGGRARADGAGAALPAALESARTVAVRGDRLEMRDAAGAIAVTLVRA